MTPKIIFDLSEVLIAGLVGIEASLASVIDMPEDKILHAFAGELLEDICCGKISEYAYLEKIIHSQVWDVPVPVLKNCIRANFHHEIKGSRAILRRLVQQYGVVLLSDHAKEWVDYIQALHPFVEDFKQVFYSYKIGTTKKNPETFQTVLENMSWYSEDCWLIDDSAKNIEVAASVGINGIQFINAKQLQNKLINLSIW